MHPATSYSSESNLDQEGPIAPVVQSQQVYGNMGAFTIMPQIPGNSFYFPSLLYTGPSQGIYHQPLLGQAYGQVTLPNASIILPNVPIILPHLPLISPQIMGAAMYPFPFQLILPQIMYQPSFIVGHMPQLNDPRTSIVAPRIPFPIYNEQPQIAYQSPVEPAISSESSYNSFSNHVEQPQSISQPSFDSMYDEGRQPHDSIAPPQVQNEGLVPASNIYSSSSKCIEQPQSTYKSSIDPTFDVGQEPHNSTHPSQVQSSGLAATGNIDPSSFYYHGQPQNTYQPSFDPAICREQMYDHNIPYQAPDVGIEHEYAHKELNNDTGPTSKVSPFYPTIHSEEPHLSSFQPASDYRLASSGSQVSSSALGSVNQDHYSYPNDRRSYSYELSNPLAVPDFQQNVPRETTSLLKRSTDEIYPSGLELDSSGQFAPASSFEDAPRPRKRLKEADIASTSYVPEEWGQSLAVTPDYHDPHSSETLLVDGCRISHNQRIDIPVQRSMYNETRNDISMFRDTQGFSIGGNPTFTNIGVKQVTNYSGSHDLKILKKFVSFDALHDSFVQDPSRRCHPGTRINVLARLQGWMDDPGASERIVWLHGLPGAGKSSVAQTIARLYDKEKKVAATFLFYRSDPSRNDGNRLFTTIAWQLASSIPDLKTHLVNALTQRPDLPMKDVETQFEELVIQPFYALNDAASHLELPLAPVVIIDGVDECTDEKLQQRILNVIGNAIRDCRVPLRFLILSRPEAHIKETVDQFKCSTLCIDLDSIDNANKDIERFFNAEFSRIAHEQGFDPTWPGHRIIQELVCNSSGQFVYAATVIKYVGDLYNCAKAQLDIILGLRKRPSASPFAPLDELYTEILKRQLDQDFLKDVLAIWNAYGLIKSDNELELDFPMLLNVSEEEMGRKLRGMRSLLAFEHGYIDIHHQSFLDFLRDVSRSGQYHISKQASSRRYLELMTGAIVRYISVLIDQLQCHDVQHLHLKYSNVSSWWPLGPSLAVEDLREILQPLVDLQDKLLNLPNFNLSWTLASCKECNVFELMRNLLLQLALSQAKSYCIASSTSGRVTGPLMVEQEGDHITITSLPKINEETKVSNNDLDRCLTSLLAYMRNTLSSSPTIAKKVCSVLDAQNLVNLIDSAIHDRKSIKNGNMNLACKAFHLVREINARVPVLPQSLLLCENTSEFASSFYGLCDDDCMIEALCTKGLMCRFLDLDCNFTDSTRLILDFKAGYANDLGWDTGGYEPDDIRINSWRKRSNLSHGAMFQVMLELSKAFQYLHSVGIALDTYTNLDLISISLNSSYFRPKLPMLYLYVKDEVNYTYENDVFIFGRIFYEMYFNIKVPYDYEGEELKRRTIVQRPPEPEIHEDAWQLIQRCCAEDPESRPTIDEVVQEMESWEIMESESRPTIDDREVVQNRGSLGLESEIVTPVSSSSID